MTIPSMLEQMTLHRRALSCRPCWQSAMAIRSLPSPADPFRSGTGRRSCGSCRRRRSSRWIPRHLSPCGGTALPAGAGDAHPGCGHGERIRASGGTDGGPAGSALRPSRGQHETNPHPCAPDACPSPPTDGRYARAPEARKRAARPSDSLSGTVPARLVGGSARPWTPDVLARRAFHGYRIGAGGSRTNLKLPPVSATVQFNKHYASTPLGVTL